MKAELGDRFQPWRLHDLRRTAASGMAALGFQPHVIERVLNHVSGAQGGLVGVYQRHEYRDDRKRAILAWGEHVIQLVSVEAPASECGAVAGGVRMSLPPKQIASLCIPSQIRYPNNNILRNCCP